MTHRLGDRPIQWDYMQQGTPLPQGVGPMSLSQPMPVPSPASDAFVNALKQAFQGKDIRVLSEPLPFHAPPYRALPVEDFQQRILVDPTIALAVTSATEIATAYSGTIATINVPGTGANDWNVISRIPVPDFNTMVIRGIGVWGYGVGAQRNVRWSLLVGGTIAIDDRMLLYTEPDDPIQAQIIVKPGQEVILRARLTNPISPYLVESRITGYFYQNPQSDDSERGQIPRSGQSIEGSW